MLGVVETAYSSHNWLMMSVSRVVVELKADVMVSSVEQPSRPITSSRIGAAGRRRSSEGVEIREEMRERFKNVACDKGEEAMRCRQALRGDVSSSARDSLVQRLEYNAPTVRHSLPTLPPARTLQALRRTFPTGSCKPNQGLG